MKCKGLAMEVPAGGDGGLTLTPRPGMASFNPYDRDGCADAVESVRLTDR